MALSDEVKAKVSLRALAEQTVTWDRHKSTPAKGDYWAPCPFHGEKTASFHVTEPQGSGGQFFCFGCQAKGSAIDFLMQRDGLSFTAAVRALADGEGITRTQDPARLARVKAQAEERQKQAEADAADAAERGVTRARKLWRDAVPDHPILAAYLEARGIRLDVLGGIPPSLRLIPDLKHYAEGGKTVLYHGPAMVGFIGRKELMGVHLTWIAQDPRQGRARMADGTKLPKKFRGRTGSIFGSPVVLWPPEGRSVIAGEGIETTLAALAATVAKCGGLGAHVEAALSLPALAGPEAKTGARRGKSDRTGKPLPVAIPDLDHPRPGWLPPPGVTKATILADPSSRCPDTARLHAERALAKIQFQCPDGARLAIPRGHWDHDDDFADLAKTGELYA